MIACLKRSTEWSRLSDRYFWLTAFIIAKNAVRRDYQNSYLGMIWAVVIPLIQVMIFAIIMPLIMARPIENYAFYLVASFPLWVFISGSLVQSCTSILNQGETIKRCMISAVIFPVADIMKNFYNYLVAFLTMYVFCLLFYVEFDPVILMLPVVVLPLVISVLALAIGIAYSAPYIRDVGYFVHLAMNLLFWFTPVVYTLSQVPEQFHWMYWLNPFYVLMHPVQQLVFYHQLPALADLTGLGVVMGLSMIFSFIMYRLCRRNYVYYL